MACGLFPISILVLSITPHVSLSRFPIPRCAAAPILVFCSLPLYAIVLVRSMEREKVLLDGYSVSPLLSLSNEKKEFAP
jgi:hypothetical protein